jgi:hypothetical protein
MSSLPHFPNSPAAKPTMGVRRRHLTADERNEALARRWAKQFADYCTAQGWWITSHSILDGDANVIYDLDRPSRGFDALFIWVTGATTLTKAAKMAIQIIRASGSWADRPLPRPDNASESKVDALFAEGDIVLPGGEA